jgi:hypothetical protein
MNSRPRAADPVIELARVEKVYRSGSGTRWIGDEYG